MARAFPNPAIRYGLPIEGHALALVKGAQLVRRLKGTILFDRLRPGDTRCSRDMAAALCRLRHPRRGDDFACEFVGGADVDQVIFPAFEQGLEDEVFGGPYIIVGE